MQLADRKLFWLGWISLVCGVGFYAIARPRSSTYFFGKWLPMASFSRPVKFPEPFQGSFPDFVHPFAFCLIGIGLLSLERGTRLRICTVFLLIDLFFKIGLNYKDALVSLIPPWFTGVPLLENVGPFFLRGTFDVNDVLAMVLGAAMAFVISEILTRKHARGEAR